MGAMPHKKQKRSGYMYNFFKQKDMDEMLGEFENYCGSVENIDLYDLEPLEKYDCNRELGIVLYYFNGEAVAVLYDNETLIFLDIFNDSTQIIITKIVVRELDKKLYVDFESDKGNFETDINIHMYRDHSFEKEKEKRRKRIRY